MMPVRMMIPPMVGVPAFFLWLCGPSSRISSPICFFLSHLMNIGPRIRQISIAVIVAPAVRNVI